MATPHPTDPSLFVDTFGRVYSRDKKSQKGRTTTHAKEYKTWHRIVKCCTDPKNRLYYKYGGVGLTVSEEWIGSQGFDRFIAHVGPAPSPQHTIDRIDGTKGYHPGNVRWATWTEQQRNRKSNRNITFNGKTQCVAAWAESLGISRNSVLARLKKGWSMSRALTEMPSQRFKEMGEKGGTEAQRRRKNRG